jgi:hypothetical protein
VWLPADPKPDLEGPLAQLFDVALTLQLHRADEGRAAAQLVKSEQTQGVAHDDGDTAPAERARIPQAAKEHRERRKAQVGFRLAAAGGKEEQVHQFAISFRGFGHGC